MTTTLSVTRQARNLSEGDTIRHLDGRPAKISRVGTHRDAYGLAYDFSFDNGYNKDNQEGFIPFATRGNDLFEVLLPIPQVGDLATLYYPSDCYPFIVTEVSTAGQKIAIAPLAHRVVAGSFQTNNAVIEYSKVPDNVGIRFCYWSKKRGCFTVHGTPVSIGRARFYQAPEV